MTSSQDQAALVQNLLEKAASASYTPSIDCCLRFLVGSSWNLDEAWRALEASMKWRADVKPETSNCPECIKDPTSHNLRVVGFDTLDRPVLYTCFGQAKNRFIPEYNVAHLCRVLEDTMKVMDLRKSRRPPPPADSPLTDQIRDGRWVLVVDYEGFGMSDCSPKTMSLTNQIMQNYPERLALCVQLDAPFLFSAVWRMVLPILPEVTANKITFLKRSELRAKMGNVFGSELIDWLDEEIAENRDPVRSKGKKYWEWLEEEGTLKKHDARGTSSWVSSSDYQLPNCTDLHCNSAKLQPKT